MAIERRLTEIVGPVGGKLHTARSRNDQVATDLALYVRDRASARGRADRRADGAAARRSPRRTATGRCPATRTCSAPSPSTSATTCSPTSGCSSATRSASTPRARLDAGDAARLGRARRAQLGARPRRDRRASSASRAPSPNSIDAVSNRDFALDYLYAAAVCATHLSRLGAEIVLWSSQEFGFCEPADDFASGSSIMPQKKNPDAAELLRAKAPRVTASLTTLARRPARAAARLLQGPAGGQGGAVRRRRHDRALPRGGRAAARRAALRPRAARRGGRRRDGRRRPTSPTCWSARGCRSARRTAWSAAWCATALESGPAALRARAATSSPRHSELLDDEYYEVLAEGAWLDSKRLARRHRRRRGSTSSSTRGAARRSTSCGARARLSALGESLLRPLGPRRRPRADRLRAVASTASAG